MAYNNSQKSNVMELELAQKKKLYNQVKLNLLPDGGAKLKKQINDLESALNTLTINGLHDDCSSYENKDHAKGKSEKHLNNNVDSKSLRSYEQGIESSKVVLDTNVLDRVSLDGSTESSTSGISKSLPSSVREKDTTGRGEKTISQSDDKKTSFDERQINKISGNKNIAGDEQIRQKEHSSKSSSFSELRNKCGDVDTFVDSCPKTPSFTCYRDGAKISDASGVSNKRNMAEKASVTGNAEACLSFSDVRKTWYGSNGSSDVSLPKTPSFTEYRSTTASFGGSKLTNAKHLPPHLLGNNHKASYQIGTLFPNHMSLVSAKQDAVVNIHKSLQTYPSDTREETDPSKLKTPLMKHQRQALSWLMWRETQVPQGGILADDMGLGKTLTMIALILKDLEENDIEKTLDDNVARPKTLVVCMACLLRQWNNEIKRHCTERAAKVLIYQGSSRSKVTNEVLRNDIVLTSYELVRTEGLAMQSKGRDSPLFAIRWQRIILDEAHYIKNHKAPTAQWIFKLEADKKWAVTGTPIHNDLTDIYSLLKFLQCEPFDDYKVWKKLIKDPSERSADRRNALVKSILFRRCKNQLDESGEPLVKLPEKHTKIRRLKLNETEMKVYEELFDKSKEKIDGYITKITGKLPSPSAGSGVGMKASTFLVMLLRLQQCCNHLSLLRPSDKGDSNDDSVSDLLSDFSSLNIDNKKKSSCSSSETALDITINEDVPEMAKLETSTKITHLLKLLKKISDRSGQKDKSVVVSQWVSMLDIVACHLEENGIEHHVIKGGMKPEAQVFAVDDFNSNPDGPRVMLLSLKAGGVGLNLVGGNHLFLLDLHWNPALETQVCDRIYRVGQDKDVFIYKFICEGTIEEKIVNLQVQKKQLARHVLNGAKSVSEHLSFEDIKKLFSD